MNERIREFLMSENKSSAQFAEEIGVQPSGISHILSGRNNPSLDFVLKMLEKYRNISTDWLLFGNGPMYKEGKIQSLFDNSAPVNRVTDSGLEDSTISEGETKTDGIEQFKTFTDKEQLPGHGRNKVVKIVWFYDNNSFEEFLPRK
ncbi:MAG TPA: helix-turn-helix transcriptional regulator [Bacteroidales bacterium]|nr:helix-turn-helix transcriptional regulator [Bacteroidales bacterium]